MDSYDPGTVFSSIDHAAATPMATSRASPNGTSRGSPKRSCRSLPKTRIRRSRKQSEAIDAFGAPFRGGPTPKGLRRKLGLPHRQQAGDLSLAQGLLDLMAKNGADFTLTFRRLCVAAAEEPENGDASVRRLFLLDPTPPTMPGPQQWRPSAG